MNASDYQAISGGLDSIARAREAQRVARARIEELQERREQLKMELEAREKSAALERDFRERVAKKEIERYDRDREAREREAKGRIEADAIRRFGKTWDEFGDFVSKESDPVTKLARAKAKRELGAMDSLPAPHANAGLADEVQALELEKKKRELEAGPVPATAKITQNFGPDGKSRGQFQMPIEEFRKTVGAASYRSPYADDIADTGRKIAEQQAEQDGGDLRTGFMNLGSRKSIIDEATRKQRRLQALELQDMLAKGIIDQAEADRRATLILGGAGK